MIPVTLVHGASNGGRELAIAQHIAPHTRAGVILEGLPDLNSSQPELQPRPDLEIARVVSGCPCCTGKLVLKVHLDRMLRHSPEHIYLSLASTEHVENLRAFLRQAPYDVLLYLTDDLLP